MSTSAQRFEILLVPRHVKDRGELPSPEAAIRSGIVTATGQTGNSGYPRFVGDGFEADIDPVTRTVEAVLLDGSELDYGLVAIVSERRV
ncbi:hypothetical protein GCM10020367_67980 [Streptomyces sannanensis]|uniref:Inorganic pyrophosphatase n=1 Tax=Streptomyces sannanensis TaxID=285536 RepID=A0ABP6S3N2_9ACTN